jgi:hypothetical protein
MQGDVLRQRVDIRGTIEVKAVSPIATAEAAMRWMIDEHLNVAELRETVSGRGHIYRRAQNSVGCGYEAYDGADPIHIDRHKNPSMR